MGISIQPTDEGTRITVSVKGAGSRTLHGIGEDEEQALKSFKETFKVFSDHVDIDNLPIEKGEGPDGPVPEDLNLPDRVTAALAEEGITRLEDVPRSLQVLVELEGVGEVGAQDLLDTLEERGAPQPEDPYVGVLGLSNRAFNALWKADMRRVSQVPRSLEGLQAIKGVGKGTAQQILDALESHAS